MDYTVEKIENFKVIGFERVISNETAYKDCPNFWSEYQKKFMMPLLSRGVPENELEQAICDNNIGEFGVCICNGDNTFRYIIAGEYKGGAVPQGMTVYTFPDMEWAKCKCVGKMPQAIQKLNSGIFDRWIPENEEYELAMIGNVEWYSKGDTLSDDYESGIWVPVKKKV